MAASAAQAEKVKKIDAKKAADKGYGVREVKEKCPGVGSEVKSGHATKDDYYRGRKYQCPVCLGYYAKKSKGTFKNGKPKWVINTHTKKTYTSKPFSLCAECGDEVYEVDFLCQVCRDADIEGSN